MGGKFHLKLNIGARPIANKYREGKMKRTLKRELKVREIVERETLETSDGRRLDQLRKPSRWISVYSRRVPVSISLACRRKLREM